MYPEFDPNISILRSHIQLKHFTRVIFKGMDKKDTRRGVELIVSLKLLEG